jgi:hypothetical protein
MNDETILLPAPMLLAIAYAPVPVRARLAWLLSLDHRLSDILNRTGEPMIAQLRLSWWRDALKSHPDKRPKGEPLLAQLSGIEPDDVLIDAGSSLIDAFEILATDADSEGQSFARMQRISAIAKAYAIWSGCAASLQRQIDQIASWWASPADPLPKPLPRILRPLSILALAEHLESLEAMPNQVRHGLRLNWHALTGR